MSGCVNRQSPEEQQQFEERYTKAQHAVTTWIKKYALYPDSYESVSFSEYSESVTKRHDEEIPNSRNYVIKHTHKLLDKDRNMTTFTGYFILEHDYSINRIEIQRSNSSGGAFPPQTQIWTDKYGRPLNKQDSIDFDNQQKQVRNKIINDLKSGLEKGDVYTENPTDMDKLKGFLDTVEKKK